MLKQFPTEKRRKESAWWLIVEPFHCKISFALFLISWMALFSSINLHALGHLEHCSFLKACFQMTWHESSSSAGPGHFLDDSEAWLRDERAGFISLSTSQKRQLITQKLISHSLRDSVSIYNQICLVLHACLMKMFSLFSHQTRWT